MKWDSLTPIQEKTIPLVFHTQNDLVISSGTASGKTEAALLPILSMVEKDAMHALKVIYVSPLKALINNQFERIEKICEHSDIAIHRWHGDVSQSKKKRFLENPTGILQITPESIESMFVNRSNLLRAVFKDVDFIIIDEIHSFFDNARGVHLRSLLSRLAKYAEKPPRQIGLSATVDNFELVKSWLNYEQPDNVEVLNIKGNDKNLKFHLMHVQQDAPMLPLELLMDLRELTRDRKAVVFCNNRGQVEEVTVGLNRLADREGMGETYYPHHSSIDKKEREYVEKVMTESTLPKSVIATSSLELGIDIGNIEIVIQIDSTFSVSSLKQRLGRSGRKRDADQLLQLYSTSEPNLIQSLAVMELVIENWVEPSTGYQLPFDVLFQQLISICQETDGVRYPELLDNIRAIPIFHSIEEADVQNLISHMINEDYLEVIKGSGEIIVGLAGEKLLRSKDFYAVFMSSQEYEVMENHKKIGKLDQSFILNEGDNLILAGKLWRVKDIDHDRKKVYVEKAVNGKKPSYSGFPGYIHPRIREKMMEILCSTDSFRYVNDSAVSTLNDERKKYVFNEVTPSERIIWSDREEMIFEAYTGTKITKTLVWMLRYYGVNAKIKDSTDKISFPHVDVIQKIFNKIKNKSWVEADLVPYVYEQEWLESKYSKEIGEELAIKMHIANEFKINEAVNFLQKYELRIIEAT
ncbi:DEAD/DEAH box helicase [Planococcus lenghuensis]|nr:DEAD/DEAH box helicase [Planococcus lenghuensis]